MATAWRIYSRLLEKHPWKTQAVQTGILMCIGDSTAQFLVERRQPKHYDFRRTATFGSLGLFFLGPSLRCWYLTLDKFVGLSGKTVVVMKVALDQLLFAPSCLLAIFSLLGTLQGQPIEEIKLKIQQDYYDTLIAGWVLWPAAQLINFYFTPAQHRILFVNVVALFWNTYLSYKTSKALKS